MQKKGFPQSYNIHKLIDFIIEVKLGKQLIKIPVYSHVTHDIIHNVQQIIYTPNILIIEGLNVLQTNYDNNQTHSQLFIPDFIDFSIYIDATEFLLRKWYIHRFLKFFHTTLFYPNSYFYQYSQLSTRNLISIASSTWNQINQVNLKNYILPTKKYANLIVYKGTNHTINSILLKQTNDSYKHI